MFNHSLIIYIFIFYFKYMLLPKYKVAFLVSYFFHLNILVINLFYIYSVFFIIIEQFIFVKIDKDIKYSIIMKIEPRF